MSHDRHGNSLISHNRVWKSFPLVATLMEVKTVHTPLCCGATCVTLYTMEGSYYIRIPTSVSGLGMRTGGLIFRVTFRKSHSPMMYCTGTLT